MNRRSPLDPIWVLAILGSIFAFVSTNPIQPEDFWGHMAVGRIVFETGAVPTTDLFSFTAAGQPYIYQSWLAGLIFFVTHYILDFGQRHRNPFSDRLAGPV